jgi:hypothetical protein
LAAETADLVEENRRLQAAVDRLQKERQGLLASNAQLVACAAGNDPEAVIRATFGGSPTLTLRALARFQGLQPDLDARLLAEFLRRTSGYQFIDPEEMSEFCRELRRVLRAFKPARSLVCVQCGEPGTLAAAVVNGRYLAFRFHHRGAKVTHAGTNNGRVPSLESITNYLSA